MHITWLMVPPRIFLILGVISEDAPKGKEAGELDGCHIWQVDPLCDREHLQSTTLVMVSGSGRRLVLLSKY